MSSPNAQTAVDGRRGGGALRPRGLPERRFGTEFPTHVDELACGRRVCAWLALLWGGLKLPRPSSIPSGPVAAEETACSEAVPDTST